MDEGMRPAMNNEVILEVEGLTKRFGGVTAVDDVSVTCSTVTIFWG